MESGSPLPHRVAGTVNGLKRGKRLERSQRSILSVRIIEDGGSPSPWSGPGRGVLDPHSPHLPAPGAALGTAVPITMTSASCCLPLQSQVTIAGPRPPDFTGMGGTELGQAHELGGETRRTHLGLHWRGHGPWSTLLEGPWCTHSQH